MTEQRDLPIREAETSRQAYAATVSHCELSPVAEAIALWVIEVGEKEVLAGERVMTAKLPSQRRLAARLNYRASSICRGLAELERVGLSIRPGRGKQRRIKLNLSRVCELANARATDAEPLAGFGRGWRPPQTEPAESRPGEPSAPSRSIALHRAPSRSIALHRAPSRSIALHRAPSRSVRGQRARARATDPRRVLTKTPSRTEPIPIPIRAGWNDRSAPERTGARRSAAERDCGRRRSGSGSAG